jgi:hypothetical protein
MLMFQAVNLKRAEAAGCDQMMDMVKSKKLIWLVARLFALFISPLQGYKGRGHGSSPITASRPPKP